MTRRAAKEQSANARASGEAATLSLALLLLLLIFGSLRGGEGWTIRPPKAGGDRTSPPFRFGQGCPIEKPGQPSTHPEQRRLRRAPRRVPSLFGYFFSGQAEKK